MNDASTRFVRDALSGAAGSVAGACLLALTLFLGVLTLASDATAPLDSSDMSRLAWRVDLNSAPEHELQLLRRVGPALAARIVADRAEHGPFETIEDLDRVRGIGERTIAGLARHAVVVAPPP